MNHERHRPSEISPEDNAMAASGQEHEGGDLYHMPLSEEEQRVYRLSAAGAVFPAYGRGEALTAGFEPSIRRAIEEARRRAQAERENTPTSD